MITIIPSTPTDDNYYYTYKDNYSDNFISVHTYKWLRYVYYKHALPLTMFNSDWLSMFFIIHQLEKLFRYASSVPLSL